MHKYQCFTMHVGFLFVHMFKRASVVAQTVKNPAAMQERVWSLGQKDPLEKGMATQSSILAWRIPWTEESGGLQSTGSQRDGHNWATNTFTFHIFKKNTALKWTNYLVLGWSFLTEHYLAPMKLSTNAFSSLIPSKQRKPTWWMEVGEGGREAVCRLNHTLSGFLSSSQLSILQRCSGYVIWNSAYTSSMKMLMFQNHGGLLRLTSQPMWEGKTNHFPALFIWNASQS